MLIQGRNISENLWCAMRVHLMNDTELHVFCPAEDSFWKQSCQDVSFENFTAISVENERLAIGAFRESVGALLSGYPTTVEEDEAVLQTSSFRPRPLQHDDGHDDDDEGGGDDGGRLGAIATAAVQLRLREKYVTLCLCSRRSPPSAAIILATTTYQSPTTRYNSSSQGISFATR